MVYLAGKSSSAGKLWDLALLMSFEWRLTCSGPMNVRNHATSLGSAKMPEYLGRTALRRVARSANHANTPALNSVMHLIVSEVVLATVKSSV